MPEETLIQFPLIGGVDEKESTLLTQRVLEMRNLVERKTGELEKRYGYAVECTDNSRYGGGTAPTPTELFAYEDTLVRIGADGDVDAYVPSSPDTPWRYMGRVSEGVTRAISIATSSAAATFITDPTSSTRGNYTATVWGELSGVVQQIRFDVIDNATGAKIVAGEVVDSALVNESKFLGSWRVQVGEDFIGVVWVALNGVGPSSVLYGRWWDITAQQWEDTRVLIIGGASVGSFLACTVDMQWVTDTRWLILAVDAGNIISLNDVGRDGIVDSSYDVATDVTVACVSLYYASGRAWISFDDFDADNELHKLFAATGDTTAGALSEDVPATLIYGLSTTTSAAFRNAVVATGATARVVNSQINGSSVDTRVHGIVRTNTPSFTVSTSIQVILNSQLAARPWVFGSLFYAYLTRGFIVDITNTLDTGESTRIVAFSLANQGYGQRTSLSVSETNAFDSSSYRLATNQINAATLSAGAFASNIVIAEMVYGAPRKAVESNRTLVVGGGALQICDGNTVFEAGFAYAPDVTRSGSSPDYGWTPATGGALTPSASYGYLIVYAYQDTRGNYYRSAPSLAVVVTLGSGDSAVNTIVPFLNITNRSAQQNPAKAAVFAELYRTVANGATYHLAAVIPNNVNASTFAYKDTSSDSTIRTRPTIYTTGGVLENQAPPSCREIFSYRNSLLLAGTDDQNLYFSKQLVQGEGPAFSGIMTQGPFEGGDVVALGECMGSLAVFKAGSVFRIAGEPPDDFGQSSLTAPELVQADVGCNAVKGIVQTPDGVEFASETGLCLLDRSWSVQWTGKAIEQTFEGASWIGAQLVPKQNLVRFVRRDLNAGANAGDQIATRDYYHSRMRGTSQWSVDEIEADPNPGAAFADIRACTVWRNGFVAICTDGTVLREDSSTWFDYAGADDIWVQPILSVAYAKPRGVTGRFRAWEIALLATSETQAGLTITLRSNRDQVGQTGTWTAAQILALQDYPYVELRQRPEIREVVFLNAEIKDVDPTGAVRGTGKGFILQALTATVGLEPGHQRAADAKVR